MSGAKGQRVSVSETFGIEVVGLDVPPALFRRRKPPNVSEFLRAWEI